MPGGGFDDRQAAQQKQDLQDAYDKIKWGGKSQKYWESKGFKYKQTSKGSSTTITPTKGRDGGVEVVDPTYKWKSTKKSDKWMARKLGNNNLKVPKEFKKFDVNNRQNLSPAELQLYTALGAKNAKQAERKLNKLPAYGHVGGVKRLESGLPSTFYQPKYGVNSDLTGNTMWKGTTVASLNPLTGALLSPTAQGELNSSLRGNGTGSNSSGGFGDVAIGKFGGKLGKALMGINPIAGLLAYGFSYLNDLSFTEQTKKDQEELDKMKDLGIQTGIPSLLADPGGSGLGNADNSGFGGAGGTGIAGGNQGAMGNEGPGQPGSGGNAW